MLNARRCAFAPRAPRDRGVEIGGLLVEVARRDAPRDAVTVDVDAQRHAAVHRDRERLRAAHAAEPGGERDRARERAAEAPAGDLGEALVGALQDALRADVDPRAGRHLPVHRQAEVLEPAELVPRRPLGHEVRVGDEHPRRPLVGAEHADRLARLHEHRLVVARVRSVAHDGVERVPRSRGAAGAAVDDELVGMLGHLGVEVVVQHPQRGFLRPTPARDLRAARRPNGSCRGTHGRTRCARRSGRGMGVRLVACSLRSPLMRALQSRR